MSDSVKQLRELDAIGKEPVPREAMERFTKAACSIDWSKLADELEALRRDPRPITPDVWREVTGERAVIILGDVLSLSLRQYDGIPVQLEIETDDLPKYVPLPSVRTAGDLRELLRLLRAGEI